MTADQQSSTGSTARGRSSKLDRELEIIRDALSETFVMISGLAAFYNETDSLIIAEKHVNVVTALVNISRTNDKLRETLLRFSQTSGYAQLASAFAMLLMPIAANHNLIPKMFLFTAGLSEQTLDSAFKAKNGAAANGHQNN